MTTPKNQTVRNTTPPRLSTASAEEWRAEAARDDDALARLAGEWDDLYGRCSTATPFLSHAWLQSWWRNYGRSGRLVVVVVRRNRRLVAAAPLIRRRMAVLTPVGAGISVYGDVLIDDSCRVEASRRLARELVAQARWRVIDIPEVPPTAGEWHLLDAWPLRTWRASGSTCLEVALRIRRSG